MIIIDTKELLNAADMPYREYNNLYLITNRKDRSIQSAMLSEAFEPIDKMNTVRKIVLNSLYQSFYQYAFYIYQRIENDNANFKSSLNYENNEICFKQFNKLLVGTYANDLPNLLMGLENMGHLNERVKNDPIFNRIKEVVTVVNDQGGTIVHLSSPIVDNDLTSYFQLTIEHYGKTYSLQKLQILNWLQYLSVKTFFIKKEEILKTNAIGNMENLIQEMNQAIAPYLVLDKI